MKIAEATSKKKREEQRNRHCTIAHTLCLPPQHSTGSPLLGVCFVLFCFVCLYALVDFGLFASGRVKKFMGQGMGEREKREEKGGGRAKETRETGETGERGKKR